ncbi:MAG: hypothetical protein ABSB32_17625 [Thermodesulfobacteriota bacterium]|jgi:hypothetical protein
MYPPMKPEELNLVRQGLLPSSEQIQKFLGPLRMIRIHKEGLLDPKTIEKLLHEVVRYAEAGHNAAVLSHAVIPKALRIPENRQIDEAMMIGYPKDSYERTRHRPALQISCL